MNFKGVIDGNSGEISEGIPGGIVGWNSRGIPGQFPRIIYTRSSKWGNF